MTTVKVARARSRTANAGRVRHDSGAPPASQQVIVIEPTTPETVYVPYYEPSVVYGAWPYPDYPPYYFEPRPGYIFGGALATGLAWSAGFAIGNAMMPSPSDTEPIKPLLLYVALAATLYFLVGLPLAPELYARIAAMSPTPPPATDRIEEQT